MERRTPEELFQSLSGHLHMVGVAGVGMAGLAYHLAHQGFTVTGCDLLRNTFSEWLERRGIPVHVGHDVLHLSAPTRAVVRTTAVPHDHVEIRQAATSGIPVFRRGEVLAALLNRYRSIAVSGTHGKTTTSALIAQLLRDGGQDPSFCVGGEVERLGGVAGVGGGPWMVAEADESDGTVAYYAPEIGVITNIEFDHMEHFETEDHFVACLETFARRCRRLLLYGADDACAQRLFAGRPGARSFGLGEGSGIRAVDIEEQREATAFEVVWAGNRLGRVVFPLPGLHNVRNALAAIGVALELGMAFPEIRTATAACRPAKRRFEVVSAGGGPTVISDYAHHPAEIRSLVETAKKRKPKRLFAVFQPHRYTRTRALGQAFPVAFEGLDELVLVPVYAASESPLEGGRSEDLCRWFDAAGRVPYRYCASLEAAWAHLRECLGEEDMLLVVGAGDVERVAAWAAQTYGHGGRGPGARVATAASGESGHG